MSPEMVTILEAMTRGPGPCADALDELADKIRAIASEMRNNSGTRDQGGAVDRCRMNVVGPDGKVKQQVDTGR